MIIGGGWDDGLTIEFNLEFLGNELNQVGRVWRRIVSRQELFEVFEGKSEGSLQVAGGELERGGAEPGVVSGGHRSRKRKQEKANKGFKDESARGRQRG